MFGIIFLFSFCWFFFIFLEPRFPGVYSSSQVQHFSIKLGFFSILFSNVSSSLIFQSKPLLEARRIGENIFFDYNYSKFWLDAAEIIDESQKIQLKQTGVKEPVQGIENQNKQNNLPLIFQSEAFQLLYVKKFNALKKYVMGIRKMKHQINKGFFYQFQRISIRIMKTRLEKQIQAKISKSKFRRKLQNNKNIDNMKILIVYDKKKYVNFK